jgi:hypothetical protein
VEKLAEAAADRAWTDPQYYGGGQMVGAYCNVVARQAVGESPAGHGREPSSADYGALQAGWGE